jgi:uncharacterized protein (TIGR02246 family)
MGPLEPCRSADVDRAQFDDEIAMTASRANEILDKGSMTDDERAIRDLVTKWMKASETGDVDAVLSLMADDVIFMVPGREPFGKDVFRATLETMKSVRLNGTSDIRELKVLGNWAYIRNYIEITIMPPDGAAMRRTGYTLSILRKQSDGKWVLWQDANLVV